MSYIIKTVPTPQFWVMALYPEVLCDYCPEMYEVVTKSDSFDNYFFKMEYDFSGMLSKYASFLIPALGINFRVAIFMVLLLDEFL